jgi:hypothetical protein
MKNLRDIMANQIQAAHPIIDHAWTSADDELLAELGV